MFQRNEKLEAIRPFFLFSYNNHLDVVFLSFVKLLGLTRNIEFMIFKKTELYPKFSQDTTRDIFKKTELYPKSSQGTTRTRRSQSERILRRLPWNLDEVNMKPTKFWSFESFVENCMFLIFVCNPYPT